MTEQEQQAYVDGFLSKVAQADDETVSRLGTYLSSLTGTPLVGTGIYGGVKDGPEGALRGAAGGTAGAIGAGGATAALLYKLLTAGRIGNRPYRGRLRLSRVAIKHPATILATILGGGEGAYQALKGMNKEND